MAGGSESGSTARAAGITVDMQLGAADSRSGSRGINFAESPTTADGSETPQSPSGDVQQSASGGIQRRRSTRIVNALFNYEQEFIQTRRMSTLVSLEQAASLGASTEAASSKSSAGVPSTPIKEKPADAFPKPSTEEIEDQIVRSHANLKDVFFYILRLLSLVAGALAYSLFDIFFYNLGFQDDPKLYATTIGLIGVSFDFLWKYYVAIRAFPEAVSQRHWQIFFAILGACVHAAGALAVRLPYYLRGSNPSMTVRVAGTFYYLGSTYLLDFLLLPLLVSRMFWAKDASGRRSHDATVHIGWPLVFYVLFFFLSVMVTLFVDFPYRSVLMEVAVWVPMLITMGIAVWDAQQFVRYDFSYLAYYFWFIHMIPHMTGSFFNFFLQAVDESGRFFLTLSFLFLFHVFMMFSNLLSRLISSGYAMVHFLFPVQFFEYFFSALFFIDIDYASSVLFWFILAAQSVWLTFRNSGLGADVFIYTYKSYLQPFARRYDKLSFMHNIQFDGARTRLFRQSRMAVQYTVCDVVCLIVVPAQYHLTASYLSGDDLATYASYFKMTAEQSIAGVLVQRFLIVACVKLIFHLMAHVLLWYKVRVYNRQGKDFDVEPISFVHIFRAYLSRNWLFLLTMVIYTMRLCYIVFSALISAFGRASVSNSAPGLVNLLDDRYWLIALTTYTGLRFQ